jgi:hypothetical protein
MQDPIWEILKYQGRSMSWLARTTGYAHSYVRKIKCRFNRPSKKFREKCSAALMMPEASLFLLRDLPASESGQPSLSQRIAG